MEVKDVMVRNLPLDLLGPELESIFGEVGPIKKVAVIHHKKKPGDGGQVSRGFGFVKFALADDALESIKQFNGKLIRGRKIEVELTSKKGEKSKPAAAPEVKKGLFETKNEAETSRETPKISKKEVTPITSDVVVDKAVEGADGKKKRATVKASRQEIEENPQPANLRSLRIFGLSPETTQKQLQKRIQKVGVVEEIKLIQPEDAEIPVWPQGTMAQVTMSTTKDAAKLISTFDQKMLHEKKLCVRYELHVSKGERCVKLIGSSIAKTLRVIVRNLSFKATVQDLADAFSVLGPLSDVHIPTVEMPNPHVPGKMKQQSRGFAFIQFLLSNDLNKAMGLTPGATSEKKPVITICGREVTYEVAQAKKKFDEIAKVEGAGDAVDGSDENDSKDDILAKTLNEVDQDTQKVEEDEEEKDEDSSDDDEGDDDDDDSSSDEEDEISEDESEVGDSDEEKEEKEEGKKSREKKIDGEEEKKKKTVSKDVLEGRTVFVKNLPFEAKNSDIIHRFSEFGKVERATLVKDSGTGLSRGTAFITFEEKAVADQVVSVANQYNPLKKPTTSGTTSSTTGIVVLGRQVEAMIAVDRNTAKEFGKEGREELKTKKDKRNLYLKDEGMVFGVGDALRQSEGRQRHKKRRHDEQESKLSCPAGDMAKRTMAHAEKKKKLNNPLFFISPYRLSVKNLARHVDDSKLKSIFMEAAREGLRRKLVSIQDMKAQIDAHAEEIMASKHMSKSQKNDIKIPNLPSPDAPVKVKMCKVMRDLEKTDQPSRGYGFIEFASHAHALAALRWTNNNPALSSTCVMGGTNRGDESEWPRLITEFAVENKSKIQLQEKRREVAEKKQVQVHKLLKEVGADGNAEEGESETAVDMPSAKKQKKEKKLSRGQRQREKKRLQKLNGEGVDDVAGEKNVHVDESTKLTDDGNAAKKIRLNDQPAGTKKKGIILSSDASTRRQGKSQQKRGLETTEEDLVLASQRSEDAEDGKKKKRKSNKKKNYELKDDFSKMVNNYKAKLTGTASAGADATAGIAAKFKTTSARWFE